MNTPKFILIDDDPATNMVGKIILRKVYKESNTLTFNESAEGMDFLVKEVENLNSPTVVFLDLNMPRYSGFDILNKLNETPSCCPHNFHIYVLSSSIDSRDKEKACSYDFVKDYIEKPLTIEKVSALSFL